MVSMKKRAQNTPPGSLPQPPIPSSNWTYSVLPNPGSLIHVSPVERDSVRPNVPASAPPEAVRFCHLPPKDYLVLPREGSEGNIDSRRRATAVG